MTVISDKMSMRRIQVQWEKDPREVLREAHDLGYQKGQVDAFQTAMDLLRSLHHHVKKHEMMEALRAEYLQRKRELDED